MKITKSYLKEIIKEELETEGFLDMFKRKKQATSTVDDEKAFNDFIEKSGIGDRLFNQITKNKTTGITDEEMKAYHNRLKQAYTLLTGKKLSGI